MTSERFVSLVERVRESGDYDELVRQLPYMNWLGMRIDAHGDRLTAVLPFRDMIIGNPTLPAIHGGVTGAFLECTAQIVLMARMETPMVPRTISVTVDYLRSGAPRDVFAAAEVTRHGRRVAVVQARAWQDNPDAPIGALNAHFLVC